MLPIFIYILKAILVSGILLGYYWIGLRNTRFHYYNRFYLVGTVLLSLCLPLLDLQWFTLSTPESAPVQQVVQFIYQSEGITPEKEGLTWDQVLVLSLLLFSASLVIVFGLGVLKVYRLKNKGKVTVMERFDFIETALDEAPFSFFRNLFWRKDLPVHDETGQRMLKHELTHIEQYHSYDKLLVSFTTYLFWMNPFFWIIRKELEVVHEFIADEEAVAGDDAAVLAEMLLKAHYHSNSLSVGQSFFYSSIKRRIIMLTSSKKVSYSYARRLLILPVAIGVLVLLSFTIKDSLSDNPNNQMDLSGIAESKRDTVPAKYRDPKTGKIKGSFRIDIDGDMASFKDIKSKKELFKVPLHELAGPTNKVIKVQGYPLTTEKKIVLISTDSMPAGTTFIGTSDTIRLHGSPDGSKAPRIIINGKEISPADLDKIDPSTIKAIVLDAVNETFVLGKNMNGMTWTDATSAGEKKIVTMKVDSVMFDGKAADHLTKEIVAAEGDKGKKIVTRKVDSVFFQGKALAIVSGPTMLRTTDKEIMEKAMQGENVTTVNIVEEGGKKVYYIQKKVSVSNNIPSVTLFVVDGKVVSEEDMNAISPDKIQSINVIKGTSAEIKYGEKGKNGVIEITTKKN